MTDAETYEETVETAMAGKAGQGKTHLERWRNEAEVSAVGEAVTSDLVAFSTS